MILANTVLQYTHLASTRKDWNVSKHCTSAAALSPSPVHSQSSHQAEDGRFATERKQMKMPSYTNS